MAGRLTNLPAIFVFGERGNVPSPSPRTRLWLQRKGGEVSRKFQLLHLDRLLVDHS